eukprot:gene9241-55277_t
MPTAGACVWGGGAGRVCADHGDGVWVEGPRPGQGRDPEWHVGCGPTDRPGGRQMATELAWLLGGIDSKHQSGWGRPLPRWLRHRLRLTRPHSPVVRHWAVCGGTRHLVFVRNDILDLGQRYPPEYGGRKAAAGKPGWGEREPNYRTYCNFTEMYRRWEARGPGLGRENFFCEPWARPEVIASEFSTHARRVRGALRAWAADSARYGWAGFARQNAQLRAAWDSHGESSQEDCLHYCQPGVMSEWARLTYTVLAKLRKELPRAFP